ncbi:MAG: hypothetical protein B1H11_10915 [Desulfobacteraceae bacterium 4484_190.1]|nr:MAG: hypothetical protein B1H11_10915 [Desulfobacteraceae bacterium 4484_190.1]
MCERLFSDGQPQGVALTQEQAWAVQKRAFSLVPTQERGNKRKNRSDDMTETIFRHKSDILCQKKLDAERKLLVFFRVRAKIILPPPIPICHCKCDAYRYALVSNAEDWNEGIKRSVGTRVLAKRWNREGLEKFLIFGQFNLLLFIGCNTKR